MNRSSDILLDLPFLAGCLATLCTLDYHVLALHQIDWNIFWGRVEQHIGGRSNALLSANYEFDCRVIQGSELHCSHVCIGIVAINVDYSASGGLKMFIL